MINPFRVGDTIKLKTNRGYSPLSQNTEYLVTCTDNSYVGFKLDDDIDYPIEDTKNGTKTSWAHEMFVLVEKAKNIKEIVGYKLIKGLPDLEAGAEFRVPANAGVSLKDTFHLNGDSDAEYFFKRAHVEKTEWFEPIYKEEPKEIIVETTSGKVKVTSDYIYLGLHAVRVVDVKKSFTKIQNVSFITGEYADQFHCVVDTFKIGCKTFNVSDIKLIKEAIKTLSR